MQPSQSRSTSVYKPIPTNLPASFTNYAKPQQKTEEDIFIGLTRFFIFSVFPTVPGLKGRQRSV